MDSAFNARRRGVTRSRRTTATHTNHIAERVANAPAAFSFSRDVRLRYVATMSAATALHRTFNERAYAT